MAGAAHLLNDDAAVFFVRCMRIEISVGLEGKYFLDVHMFSKNTDRESIRDVLLSSTRQHDDKLTYQHENTTNS